jgi:hypothetical protein
MTHGTWQKLPCMVCTGKWQVEVPASCCSAQTAEACQTQKQNSQRFWRLHASHVTLCFLHLLLLPAVASCCSNLLRTCAAVTSSNVAPAASSTICQGL